MKVTNISAMSSDRDTDDRSLLALIARRDRDALADLYRRYHARLFKFVFRLTHSHAVADELVNDIMLAVWLNAEKFRGDSKPSTWLFGIAYRQTLKRLTKKKLSFTPAIEPDELADEHSPSIEREDWVQRGVQSLPAAQRLAVELVFFLGLSYEEVAAVTDCPVNTVKTRMFYARRKLKDRLEASALQQSPPEAIG